MGLLEFLDDVINSRREFSYDEFMRGFNSVVKSERIIEKIDSEIIQLCTESLHLVNERVSHFREFKNNLELYVKMKSGRSAYLLKKAMAFFKDIHKEYSEEEKMRSEEETVYGKITELGFRDSKMLAPLFRKLKMLEALGLAVHHNIAGRELFDKMAQEREYGSDLDTEIMALNSLIREEEAYLKNFKGNPDLKAIYIGRETYLNNIESQKNILVRIKEIERDKSVLIRQVVSSVQHKVADFSAAYSVVVYLPKMGIVSSSRVKGYVEEQSAISALHLADTLNNEFILASVKNIEGFYKRTMDIESKVLRQKAFDNPNKILTHMNLENNDLHHLLAYVAMLTEPRNRSTFEMLKSNVPISSKADSIDVDYVYLAALVIRRNNARSFNHKDVLVSIEKDIKKHLKLAA